MCNSFQLWKTRAKILSSYYIFKLSINIWSNQENELITQRTNLCHGCLILTLYSETDQMDNSETLNIDRDYPLKWTVDQWYSHYRLKMRYLSDEIILCAGRINFWEAHTSYGLTQYRRLQSMNCNNFQLWQSPQYAKIFNPPDFHIENNTFYRWLSIPMVV